jgi:hypothetical protein
MRENGLKMLHTMFGSEKERSSLENIIVYRRIVLKYILKELIGIS